MDKKNWIIVALSLVIVILVWINITGDRELKSVIDEISGQRNDAIRSTAIIEFELGRSIRESAGIEAENLELENIINNIISGSEKTEYHLTEYGNINNDFAEFIRQANEAD